MFPFLTLLLNNKFMILNFHHDHTFRKQDDDAINAAKIDKNKGF